MPAWWGKKSSKCKEDSNQIQSQSQSPHGNSSDFLNFSSKKKPCNTTNNPKDKPKSCDEGFFTRNSPRNSKDFTLMGAGSSGFSGFDSDSGEKRGHPLPRPSMQSDHGAGLGSGSVSVSSVSSSGSSDDHHIGTDLGQFGGYRIRLLCLERMSNSDKTGFSVNWVLMDLQPTNSLFSILQKFLQTFTLLFSHRFGVFTLFVFSDDPVRL